MKGIETRAGRDVTLARLFDSQKENYDLSKRNYNAGRDIIVKEAADAVRTAKAEIITEVWGWFKKAFYGIGAIGLLSFRKRHATGVGSAIAWPFKKAVAKIIKSIPTTGAV